MPNLPNGTKALIFAAGMGTRLKPFTDQHPKALALVNHKPLLQRNIEYLKGFGISELVINVHHFANQIIQFLEKNDHFDCQIHISHEVNEPLETGGGLKNAEAFLNGPRPFVVMNADILTNLDISRLFKQHQQKKALATLAVTNRSSSRCFLYDENNQLTGWKNNQSGETRIARESGHISSGSFSGVHVIDPAIFELITRTGKFSIVDVYLELAAQHPIYVFDHTGDVVIDVGKPEAIEKAQDFFL